MPSITEQSAWAEASHAILLISCSDYFLIKAEFMRKAHSHSDPGSKTNLGIYGGGIRRWGGGGVVLFNESSST